MTGFLELIWGPMFCGKTSSLLHKLSLHHMCGKRTLYVNSVLDTRTAGGFSTHNPLFKLEVSFDQVKVRSLHDLFQKDIDVKQYDVIGVDESQFFPDLVGAVSCMVNTMGKVVYVGGLTGNSNMELFGHMHELIPMANKVTTLNAICEGCTKRGEMRDANFTKRIVVETDGEVQVGGHDAYMPVCRDCYHTP